MTYLTIWILFLLKTRQSNKNALEKNNIAKFVGHRKKKKIPVEMEEKVTCSTENAYTKVKWGKFKPENMIFERNHKLQTCGTLH